MLEPFRPARVLMTGSVLLAGTALAVEKLPMVAVMPLSWQGVDSTSAMVVTDALADELLRTGAVRVMERSQMEKILKEQGFQKSGACSGSECAVEIGRLLSINKIVVGTIGKLGSSYTVTARAVDIGSGEIVGSARGQIKGEIDDVPASLLPGISRDLILAMSPRTRLAPAAQPAAPAPSTVPAPLPARKIVAPTEMVTIPAGCYLKGTEDGTRWERPVTNTCVASFRLDRTEVTQAQYTALTGINPSKFKSCGEQCPVEYVSWDMASEYCRKLGKRLPTESEWEFAARAGTTGAYPWGTSKLEALNHVWNETNSAKSPHPVGTRKANAWGLHDMLGNIREWCEDSKRPYDTTSVNPFLRSRAEDRINRGGSWNDNLEDLAVYRRTWDSRDHEENEIGFRCAESINSNR